MSDRSIIRVPDSVLSYMTDELVESAVNQLLEKDADTKIPGDLTTWDDLRAYNRALLSAQQVKFEYVDFLHDLWDRTWGDAQRKLFKSYRLMELSKSRSEFFCDNEDVTYLPNSRSLWNRDYSLDLVLETAADNQVTVGVSYNLVSMQDGLKIFAADHSDFDLDVELELDSTSWSKELDDGWLNTLPELIVPQSGQHELDISALQQAAYSMLCAYREHFLK